MCCVMRRRQADMLSYGCTCMAHRRHRGGGGAALFSVALLLLFFKPIAKSNRCPVPNTQKVPVRVLQKYVQKYQYE